ncbi:hypothetical protein CAC42_8042 [Sphaceloma murrayae]|uniref:Frequency clock protein n=1 Tax=Sphaceloma murrayae TaxID=2082308 RepID=A0A2K1QRA4_9PEZI|nr:hypothetical protein CAC42_8042 [Sphaceloma murrayae]
MEVDTSSSNSQSSGSLHPRRQPAHKSVSLLHSPRPIRARSHEPGTGPLKQSAEPIRRPSSSPSSLKPLVGKDDSGESSNAEKWFEKSNNYASRNSTSFVDNSPPFFLQNSSSDETPPEGVAARARHQFISQPGSGSLPLRTGLLHLGTDHSSTEDFRSVIDDLTIENKKLKRKLKTYEKLHDSHLKDQKLFEVRVHGLPTSKKKELEEMLRRFALGLNPQAQNELVDNMFSSPPPALPRQKSGSSSTSNPNADSAYASASASGQGSSALSNSDSKKKQFATSARSRQQNIQTYLHDIPEGLLPRHPAAMTEKAKKKLVVRRLEQIFAGKGAVAGSQQPQQQQEVSQLAAKIDQRDMVNRGQKASPEGIREAMIMSEIIANQEAAAEQVQRDTNLTTKAKQSPPIANKAVDQRPTRPLDLDPFRAQVPSENMQYIRHLGFSPPGTEAMSPPEDGHGWIYLNLLINMAQLHTINVTPDFVRRALADHSKKFELSSCGRKVRWRGGKSITKNSSDGDSTPSNGGATVPNGMSTERGSPRKKLKTSQQGSTPDGRPSRTEILQQEQRLAYTPLFYHRDSNDDSDLSTSEDEEENTTESAFPFPVAGDSSGMASSGVKTTSTKRKRARENGPIIFYNNAKFCTDLSGDTKTEEGMLYNAFLYHSVAAQPVGVPVSGSPSRPYEAKGPLATAFELPEAMDLDDNPIPADQELDFPSASPMSDQSGKDRKAIQFEVSGLGGVYPADNFAINVESRHSRVDHVTAPMTLGQGMPRPYPSKIAHVLSDSDDATHRRARMAFHKEVVASSTQLLEPSKLPDASCFMPASDTSPDEDDETSDAEDAMSILPESADAPAPAAAPQRIEMDYTSSDSEDGDDEDEESESGSIDLLANARELDPDAIRARERQYDAEMADRLAEEIPAGSSAATAGGGSGFASPKSGVDREEWEAAKREIRERMKGKDLEMKRERWEGGKAEARGILKRKSGLGE